MSISRRKMTPRQKFIEKMRTVARTINLYSETYETIEGRKALSDATDIYNHLDEWQKELKYDITSEETGLKKVSN